MPDLDNRALRAIADVHPDLAKVVRRAAYIAPLSFTVAEGVRSLARQRRLVAAGASRTLRSRHLTGHAVDLAAKVGGQIRWDWPLYERLAAAMKAAASELHIPIEWGGDWKMRDGPHFQLTWETYP